MAGYIAQMKVVTQACDDFVCVLFVEVRVFRENLLTDTDRKAIAVYQVRTFFTQ